MDDLLCVLRISSSILHSCYVSFLISSIDTANVLLDFFCDVHHPDGGGVPGPLLRFELVCTRK